MGEAFPSVFSPLEKLGRSPRGQDLYWLEGKQPPCSLDRVQAATIGVGIVFRADKPL
jgi:hypothetical protein